MVIDVSRLQRIHGSSLDVELEAELSIQINGQKLNLVKPVNVSGVLTNIGEVLIFEGKLNAVIAVACDRCLKEFEYEINLKLNEKFAKEDNNSEDINVYHGDKIDFTSVIESNILLNLPLQFVCSEDCKGLCFNCGKNKNFEDCDCQEDEYDPRLEKLKNLFKIK